MTQPRGHLSTDIPSVPHSSWQSWGKRWESDAEPPSHHEGEPVPSAVMAASTWIHNQLLTIWHGLTQHRAGHPPPSLSQEGAELLGRKGTFPRKAGTDRQTDKPARGCRDGAVYGFPFQLSPSSPCARCWVTAALQNFLL